MRVIVAGFRGMHKASYELETAQISGRSGVRAAGRYFCSWFNE